MNSKVLLNYIILLLLLCGSTTIFGQSRKSDGLKEASDKIEKGFEKNNTDTLAQGYFDLGDSYYQKGDLAKSELNYQKAKDLYEKKGDAEGIAKSSRALAKVQEDLHKDKLAISNYFTAQKNNVKTGDLNSNILNTNDAGRLSNAGSFKTQQQLLQRNIDLGIKNKDSNEIVSAYSRMGEMNLKQNGTSNAVQAYSNAYLFSKNKPEQALRFNQMITDVYVKNNDFSKAIEIKKQALNEPFVQNSSQVKATEITSLADIYLQKKEDTTAIRLLKESYGISVKNGHTLEAKKNVEKLDSIYQSMGNKEKSLGLYRDFVKQLPSVIEKDNSLTDAKIVTATEEKIKTLETDKTLKDDLIKRKNIFNYSLMAFIALLIISMGLILFVLRKLKVKNKKIALQSLRREMNPHFIFNSLNSINQFIANNNELEANQYLTRFSTLMRRVMENSKNDFVLFSNEVELLKNYLELEKSRFPDKFDFTIRIDDALYAGEHIFLPGMLIQPYLENAIWHGLRYISYKGLLQLSFTKGSKDTINILIEDNGIGIAESKKSKTANQKKYSGRGIANTMERIKILNELYHQHITCNVEDKREPGSGVIVQLTVPILKDIQYED
jgi:hypothetical protein